MTYIERYKTKKCKCGGNGVEKRTPHTPSNYKHVECDTCGKGTCTDTNEFVIWNSWSVGNNTFNWTENWRNE